MYFEYIVSDSALLSNISYKSIKDPKEEYNQYFSKLHEFDSATIGGNIPDEGIFMEN